MKTTRINRLERQEERLKHLGEPDGVIIFDTVTQELLAYDPRALEGDGATLLIPHNNRDDLTGSPGWRKAQQDKQRRQAAGLPVATMDLFTREEK